ncbi:hypothetical protein GCM10009753_14370 [Streptantibioticus ferralitis]
MSLPGADELFRTTGGMALQSSTPRQHSNGDAPTPPPGDRLRPVPAADEDGTATARRADGDAPDGDDTAGLTDRDRRETAAKSTAAEHARSEPAEAPNQTTPAQRRPPQEHPAQERRQRRGAPNRRPSGRERHDEKITVYVSAEELMDLEHARLVLRGEHGLAVDRGRIVREAVAVVLADLESRGDASILVRRLRGR